MIMIVSLVISIYLLFKERKKTNQAKFEELHADFTETEEDFEKDKDYEEFNANEYETVRYDKIYQEKQEYLGFIEIEP